MISVDDAILLQRPAAAPFAVGIYYATFWVHNVLMMTTVYIALSCINMV